jgi:hypothetical protein
MVRTSIKQVFIPIPTLIRCFSWFFNEGGDLSFERNVGWEQKNFFKNYCCISSQTRINLNLRFCSHVLTLSFKKKKKKVICSHATNYVTSFLGLTHHSWKGKNMVNFFCQIHTKLTKISIEISTESPLYWEVPSYWQVTYTHPLFITYTHFNHFKSRTSYYSRVQTHYSKYSSFKVEHKLILRQTK